MIHDSFDGSRGHLTPLSCEGAARGALTSRRAQPDCPEWPRLGGSSHGYVSWACLIVSKRQSTHPALPRLAERNASRTGSSTQKTLQECTHSSKASGETPAGALACPHGKSQRPEGKRVLTESLSLCGSLRIPLQRLGGYCRGQP
jgi:hypothetical protein